MIFVMCEILEQVAMAISNCQLQTISKLLQQIHSATDAIIGLYVNGQFVVDKPMMKEIDIIMKSMGRLFQSDHVTTSFVAEMVDVLSKLVSTRDINLIVKLIDSDSDIMSTLVKLARLSTVSSDDDNGDCNYVHISECALAVVADIMNVLNNVNENINDDENTIKKAKNAMQSHTKLMLDILINYHEIFYSTRNLICKSVKKDDIVCMICLKDCFEIAIECDVLHIEIDNDYYILEGIIKICTMMIDCIVNEDIDIYENYGDMYDVYKFMKFWCSIISTLVAETELSGHNHAAINSLKIQIFKKYNLFELLIEGMNDSNVTIRWCSWNTLKNIFGSSADYGNDIAKYLSDTCFIQTVTKWGYLDVNNIGWCNDLHFRAIYKKYTPSMSQNGFVVQCCCVIARAAHFEESMKAQVANNLLPMIFNLLNKGLPIKCNNTNNFNLKGIHTYTIEPSWCINKNYKMWGKPIVVQHHQMILITNGFVSRYLNKLGKYNISPNDISSVIFKYFENDFNRYSVVRTSALYAITNIVCTSQRDIVLDCLNQCLTTLLCNVLQYGDLCTHQTKHRVLKYILLSLECLRYHENNNNQTNSFCFMDRLEIVHGVEKVCIRVANINSSFISFVFSCKC